MVCVRMESLGDQPHHHLRLSGGQGVKNPPNGSAGHKRLTAAGGHLHANMGRTFNRVIIGRYSAEANGYVLGKPVFPPRGKQIGSTVDAVQVCGEVTHDLLLIVVKFHRLIPLLPWNTCWKIRSKGIHNVIVFIAVQKSNY